MLMQVVKIALQNQLRVQQRGLARRFDLRSRFRYIAHHLIEMVRSEFCNIYIYFNIEINGTIYLYKTSRKYLIEFGHMHTEMQSTNSSIENLNIILKIKLL